MKTPPAKHLDYLDGMRALAALVVVWHHALLQVRFEQPLTGWSRVLVTPFYFGHYAVAVFIVLSGFCLMLPIVRTDNTLPDNTLPDGTVPGGTSSGGARHFFKCRAWRILPPYFASLALSLVLIRVFINQKTGTHWDLSLPVTMKSIGAHLLLMQDVMGEGATINHALWSIAVEWRIYFLFPLLLWSWRRFGAWKTTLSTTVGSMMLFRVCERVVGHSLHAHYIALFVFGMLGATLAFGAEAGAGAASLGNHVLGRRVSWRLASVCSGVLFVFFTWAPIFRGGAMPSYFTDVFVGIWAMCLMVWASREEGCRLRRGLSWRPLVWVGSFAYSLYLIHAPLLQVLWQGPFKSLQDKPLAMFCALCWAGTPLILLLSLGFFQVFERPFKRRGTRSLASRAAA